jgi:type II secretory pathway component GspD/PulD (secretin)
MKNNLKLFAFIFIFLMFASCPKLNAENELPFENPEATISMDLQDANLKDILKVFSIQSGLNFIASESVQNRKVTLYLDKVPIKAAMDKLFKANNLSYELDLDSNIFIVKDWGLPKVETETKIFYLKYATVTSSSLMEEMASNIKTSASFSGGTGSSGGSGGTGSSGKWGVEQDAGLTKAIKKLLSEHGSLVEDFRTNSLIVTDIPSKMPIIAQTIASLDVAVPMVMLEVEMLDVSKDVVDKLGFDFSQNPITLILPGGFARRGADFFLGTLSKRKADITSPGIGGSAVLGSTFAQSLDFLRTQTDTRYLARPRLLTLNNETAEIKITTNEAIGVTTTAEATTGTTSASPERYETGVILRVTPQVNTETGEITMFIYPQVSEAKKGTQFQSASENFQFMDPEIRSTKSMVRIKDGETVILGGLIRNEFSQVITKLPILGDLPLIGFLFRHKGSATTTSPDKNKERELLVFITPRIIKDKNIELARVNKARVPEREQSTDTTSGRQLAIISNLNNFEKKR